nr:hypothetical protein [uncultured bacterium]
MPITADQKSDILGIVADLFDASPGKEFQRDFAVQVEAGPIDTFIFQTKTLPVAPDGLLDLELMKSATTVEQTQFGEISPEILPDAPDLAGSDNALVNAVFDDLLL